MATITIHHGFHSATVKIGSCVNNYSLPGGFKKYTLIGHVRKINFLPNYIMTFTEEMVGFSALYSYIINNN